MARLILVPLLVVLAEVSLLNAYGGLRGKTGYVAMVQYVYGSVNKASPEVDRQAVLLLVQTRDQRALKFLQDLLR